MVQVELEPGCVVVTPCPKWVGHIVGLDVQEVPIPYGFVRPSDLFGVFREFVFTRERGDRICTIFFLGRTGRTKARQTRVSGAVRPPPYLVGGSEVGRD